MTDEEAVKLLQAVQAGSSLKQCARGKGSPFSEWSARKYLAAHPAFRAAVRAASKANEIAKKSVNARNRFADQTHCKQGHPYSGDNVGIKDSRGRPARFCRVCSRLSAQRVRPMSPDQVQKITTLVRQGVSMSRMFHGGALHITGYHNMQHQRAIDPAFDRMMAEHVSQGYARAARARAQARRREQANDYQRIRGMVPRWVPFDAADDVAQGVMLALLERSISRDQVAERVRVLLTEYRRGFKFGSNRMVSIESAFIDGGLHETITQGLWT